MQLGLRGDGGKHGSSVSDELVLMLSTETLVLFFSSLPHDRSLLHMTVFEGWMQLPGPKRALKLSYF